MYDLSIILPSIRTNLLNRFYDSLLISCRNHSFELIIIGPYDPSEVLNHENIKYIKDFGAPARAAQLGAIQAQGTYITWSSDDAWYLDGTLDSLLEIIKNEDRKTCVAVRYGEGDGTPMPKELHMARAHNDCQLPGILPHYMVTPVSMLNTEYFREIGGWDCQYEHLNMCCHDLIFRVQNDGGKVIIPDFTAFNCDWMPGETGDHGPIHFAYFENDLPKFNEMYAEAHEDRIKIDLNNWENAPEIWKRRFS